MINLQGLIADQKLFHAFDFSFTAPVIAAIGLGLYGVGFSGVASCFSLGLTQIAVLILFAL